jgi:hypothetical protein
MNRVGTKLAGVVALTLTAGAAMSARAAPPLPWVALQKPGPKAVSRAERLVLRALSLMQAKKWGRAARLLETTNQLDPALGAHAHLAQCYEAMGRWAPAWTAFTRAADHAGRSGLADDEKAARRRAETLEPKVVLIVLNVPPNVADTKGLRIFADDVEVERRAWADGAQPVMAVQPGTHVLRATAPGKTPWQQPVNAPDAGARVRVDVPPMAAAPVGLSAERKAAIAAGSLGAVATATGIVGLVLLSQDRSPPAVPMAIGGFTLAVPSVITAIGLAVGSPKDGKTTNSAAIRLQIRPAAGPKGASVVITGQF